MSKSKQEIKLERQDRFITIVEWYKRIIYKICYSYAGNSDELNDLYQDVILNLWRAYGNFKGNCTISTWIYRIPFNTAIWNSKLLMH